MPIPTMQIQSVTFDADGDVHVSYVLARDVKVNGVGVATTMLIPTGDNYDEEIRAVKDAVEYLVSDVLDDLPGLQSMEAAIAEEEARAAAEKAASA